MDLCVDGMVWFGLLCCKICCVGIGLVVVG